MFQFLEFLFTHLPWAYQHREDMWEIRDIHNAIVRDRKEKQLAADNIIKFPDRHYW